MMLDQIKQIISRSGESLDVELKSSTASLKSAAHTLCAFLNNDGGRVLIGVKDDHAIIGQKVTDKTKIDISHILRKFEPTANIKVEYVDIEDNLSVIVLTAYPDTRCKPYTFDGRAYERYESSTEVMSQDSYQSHLLSRNLNSNAWEMQFADDFVVSDLDKDEIYKTVEQGISTNRIDSSFETQNIETLLKKFGLLKDKQLINAAIVLFAKEPNKAYMQCVVRMARFKGIEKEILIDSKQVYGNAFSLLREIENFITRNTAIESRFEEGNMQRIDLPEYPFGAIREAVINSICHRDYSSPGGAITLLIFDDRLEIINTGLLPDGITLDGLFETHSSHPRNPKITEIFYRRGFIETLGMGIEKISNLCEKNDLDAPRFYEQSGTFVVQLRSRLRSTSKEEFSPSTRQKLILDLLQHGEMSPKAISDNLVDVDVTERTLRADLKQLKEHGFAASSGQGKKTRWRCSNNPETRK